MKVDGGPSVGLTCLRPLGKRRSSRHDWFCYKSCWVAKRPSSAHHYSSWENRWQASRSLVLHERTNAGATRFFSGNCLSLSELAPLRPTAKRHYVEASRGEYERASASLFFRCLSVHAKAHLARIAPGFERTRCAIGGLAGAPPGMYVAAAYCSGASTRTWLRCIVILQFLLSFDTASLVPDSVAG